MIPPPIQRGMTVLNRELFRREVSVIGVRVPTSLTAKFLKVLNKYVLKYWPILGMFDYLRLTAYFFEIEICSTNQS
jgi:hypothetical protein